MARKATLAAALERLYRLEKRGLRRGLDELGAALSRQGDPQNRCPTLHIAGTNGKGSVSAMLATMGRAAGLRTGLYTSPHLLRFAERVQIEGAPVEDNLLADHLTEAMDAHPELTFFEVATLAAFRIFAEAQVELLVLEVGLGGRLDATNVVARPLATAVTSIGLDHQEWLGDSLAEIAAEKAAIARASVPMVVGRLPLEAERVVRGFVERGAGPSWFLGHELSVRPDDDACVTVEGPGGRRLRGAIGLRGAHQRDNAAVACGVAWASGLFDDEAMRRGLAEVRWPGRLERLETPEGAVLLDGAHNPDGARALAASLDGAEPRALVFGAMGDKAWREMLALLAPRFAARVYVAPTLGGSTRAAAPPVELAEHMSGQVATDLTDALTWARRAVGPAGLVVVAGSLYLVGQARAALLGLPCDPQVGL